LHPPVVACQSGYADRQREHCYPFRMRGILQNASPRRPLATARKFRNTEVGERTGSKAVSVSGTGVFLLNMRRWSVS